MPEAKRVVIGKLSKLGNKELLNLLRVYVRKHPWCRMWDLHVRLICKDRKESGRLKAAMQLLVKNGEVREIGHYEQMRLRRETGERHARTGTPAYVATAKLIRPAQAKKKSKAAKAAAVIFPLLLSPHVTTVHPRHIEPLHTHYERFEPGPPVKTNGAIVWTWSGTTASMGRAVRDATNQQYV